MKNKNPIHFRRYPFQPGDNIYIEDGPRKGDWTVLSVDDRRVTLRCPVTGTEVTWNRFCYQVRDDEGSDDPGPSSTDIRDR